MNDAVQSLDAEICDFITSRGDLSNDSSVRELGSSVFKPCRALPWRLVSDLEECKLVQKRNPVKKKWPSRPIKPLCVSCPNGNAAFQAEASRQYTSTTFYFKTLSSWPEIDQQADICHCCLYSCRSYCITQLSWYISVYCRSVNFWVRVKRSCVEGMSFVFTRVVPKVMSNFFCMRTGNSRRRRVRW